LTIDSVRAVLSERSMSPIADLLCIEEPIRIVPFVQLLVLPLAIDQKTSPLLNLNLPLPT